MTDEKVAELIGKARSTANFIEFCENCATQAHYRLAADEMRQLCDALEARIQVKKPSPAPSSLDLLAQYKIGSCVKCIRSRQHPLYEGQSGFVVSYRKNYAYPDQIVYSVRFADGSLHAFDSFQLTEGRIEDVI